MSRQERDPSPYGSRSPLLWVSLAFSTQTLSSHIQHLTERYSDFKCSTCPICVCWTASKLTPTQLTFKKPGTITPGRHSLNGTITHLWLMNKKAGGHDQVKRQVKQWLGKMSVLCIKSPFSAPFPLPSDSLTYSTAPKSPLLDAGSMKGLCKWKILSHLICWQERSSHPSSTRSSDVFPQGCVCCNNCRC